MTKDMHKDLEKLEELKQLIKKLRAPDGCPWDQQQKKEDASKYLLEEALDCAPVVRQVVLGQLARVYGL